MNSVSTKPALYNKRIIVSSHEDGILEEIQNTKNHAKGYNVVL